MGSIQSEPLRNGGYDVSSHLATVRYLDDTVQHILFPFHLLLGRVITSEIHIPILSGMQLGEGVADYCC